MADWVRYWIEVASENRASSAKTDHDRAEQWIYHNLIGRYPLRGLREEHVRVWHAEMLAYRGPRSPEGLSPRTIHRIHSVLTRNGVLMVLDEGDKTTNRPRLWGAK